MRVYACVFVVKENGTVKDRFLRSKYFYKDVALWLSNCKKKKKKNVCSHNITHLLRYASQYDFVWFWRYLLFGVLRGGRKWKSPGGNEQPLKCRKFTIQLCEISVRSPLIKPMARFSSRFTLAMFTVFLWCCCLSNAFRIFSKSCERLLSFLYVTQCKNVGFVKKPSERIHIPPSYANDLIFFALY